MVFFYLDGFNSYQFRRTCSAVPLFCWSSLLRNDSLMAIITWKEATSMIFCPCCLPRLLLPSWKIKHTKTHAHSRIKKSNNNFYVWFLTQKPCSTCSTHLRGCLACLSSFSAFTLLRLLGFPCLCHELNKKNTLWDLERSFSTRGLFIPKIISPTNAKI